MFGLKNKCFYFCLFFFVINIFIFIAFQVLSSDPTYFSTDYHGILFRYPEFVLRNKTNAECSTNKILFNNSFALHLTQLSRSNTFECHSLPRSEHVLDVSDMNENSYQLCLKTESLQKLYKNVTLDPGNMTCYAEKFEKAQGNRETGDSSLKMSNIKVYFTSSNDYKISVNEHGYYFIRCSNNSNTTQTIFEDIKIILPRNMSLLAKTRQEAQRSKSSDTSRNPMYDDGLLYDACDSLPKNTTQMSVLIIQLDSISFNHFQRMFPRTFAYLKHNLTDNVVFENLMIVGENTKPNTFPLLSGVMPASLPEFGISDEDSYYYFDYKDMPLIWKDFEKLDNFVTMYNEDFLINGLFLMNQRGFKNSPADYYNFAYWKKEPSLHRIADLKYCINGKPMHSIYMNQVKQFVDRMNLPQNSNSNFFSYNMFSALSHDRFEIPEGFDLAMYEQLLEFEQNGFLDRTLMIVLGDHGGRPYAYGDEQFSKFAGLEYPNPFLSIKLPKSLRGSVYSANFMNNSHKLVTSFDLHKTLKHFYYLTRNGLFDDKKCRRLFSESVGKIRGLRGVSMFESVPQDRSCRDALIPTSFCTCITKTDVDSGVFEKETDLKFSDVSGLIVNELNKRIEHLSGKCKTYGAKRVDSAKRIPSREGGKLYEFSVFVDPGNGLFRALVQVDDDKSPPRLSLKSRVMRENKYGDTSWCLTGDEREFKDSCFCRIQPVIL